MHDGTALAKLGGVAEYTLSEVLTEQSFSSESIQESIMHMLYCVQVLCAIYL